MFNKEALNKGSLKREISGCLDIATNGGCCTGCRGLPLLVVGGETPALAKNKERQKAA
ncbi:hypothetical protein [Kingella sp. (in: b-proteobacteria)]|uniref:hypothetical protein n=1 Tax=Kingella sp. (in: b-proteobacteria) TaxID=2020713 RepID=UPI0026DC1EDD|nr:hypothetical protein [Kingella sp. (in: b-proteobacteria)]